MTQKTAQTLTKTINKILIANRGEIAARVIRTCRTMGIQSIAVYSEVDRDLDFVKLADESVCIGPAESKQSYLNVDKIVDICRQYHVDAVHPGYGFLSENADFAETLAQAGVIFIGPDPSAIRSMGSKGEAKALAEKINVPVIQGYRGEDQSPDHLLAEATKIGFPILIKATHGGGGKGMRRVESADEFAAALSACQREAQGAFSNAHVMLEKYVVNPRHIEVQIFGDQHGNVIALSERDCSLQRRHQKVIEEAPAVGLNPTLREKLHHDAIAISKAVQYVGAGTVEFLVAADDNYYFLEMNTRLQVEHPVTEMVLGLDLVNWQIRVARGEILPLQEAPMPRGHAVEARLYAEDPQQNFLPSTGLIRTFDVAQDWQKKGYWVRIDAGYRAGNRVTIYYDPLLMKVIAFGSGRREAYEQLTKALIDFKVEGIKTNRDFLLRLCQMPEVIDQYPDIAFLDRSLDDILQQPEPSRIIVALLGIGLLKDRDQNQQNWIPKSPWAMNDDWRHCGLNETTIQFERGGKQHVLSRLGTAWKCDGHVIDLQHEWSTAEEVGCTVDGHDIKAKRVTTSADSIKLLYGGIIYEAALLDIDHQHDPSQGDESLLNAPMPGRVISVLATRGQIVEAGAPLVILEAMKMEHTIRSPYPGVVEEIFFGAGDFVEEGVELARVKAA